MVAYMNEESFRKTLETGQAVYWSTSRKRLWHKGEESENVQEVHEIRVDCDGDVVLLRDDQRGDATYPMGKRSCFCNKPEANGFRDGGGQIFDPGQVYRK